MLPPPAIRTSPRERRRDRAARASVSDWPGPVSFVNVSVAGLNSSALEREPLAWTPPAIRTWPEGSVAATARRASVSDWPLPVSFVNVSVAGLNSKSRYKRRDAGAAINSPFLSLPD